MHDYMNIMIIEIFLILFFSAYIISYYDVRKPIIVVFCHYDCSLLKIVPFPELVCNYKFCSNNNKKKIRATGAQTPHSISNTLHDNPT